MLSFRQVLAFIAALLVMLTSMAAASAKTSRERHFVVAVDVNQRVVQSGYYSDVSAIVSAFQGTFTAAARERLTQQTLLEANRSKLIPACYPYQGKNVSLFRSAGDDSVWDDCPPDNQRLVIIPNSGRLYIPLKAAVDYARLEARIRQLEQNNAELVKEKRRLASDNDRLVKEKTRLASDNDRLVKEKTQLKQSTDDLKASLKMTQAESQTQKQEEKKLQTQITSLAQRNEQLASQANKHAVQGWPAVILFIFAAFMVGLILGRFKKRPRLVIQHQGSPDDQHALDNAAAMNANLSAKITQIEEENRLLLERAEQAERQKRDLDVQLANASALAEMLAKKASEQKPAPSPKKKSSGNGEKEHCVPKPPTASPAAEAAPSPATPAAVEHLARYRVLREKISKLEKQLKDSEDEVRTLKRYAAKKPSPTEALARLAELEAKLATAEKDREKAQKRANGTFKKWEESQAALRALEERVSELEGREKRQQTAV